ncbi:hypothetical protein C8J57DRAFT_1230134 [Mycena rebaudengoi]|nr:hypothetical protein C8J57DRAFT_1230134 [Mycena rebaudengoi]
MPMPSEGIEPPYFSSRWGIYYRRRTTTAVTMAEFQIYEPLPMRDFIFKNSQGLPKLASRGIPHSRTGGRRGQSAYKKGWRDDEGLGGGDAKRNVERDWVKTQEEKQE